MTLEEIVEEAVRARYPDESYVKASQGLTAGILGEQEEIRAHLLIPPHGGQPREARKFEVFLLTDSRLVKIWFDFNRSDYSAIDLTEVWQVTGYKQLRREVYGYSDTDLAEFGVTLHFATSFLDSDTLTFDFSTVPDWYEKPLLIQFATAVSRAVASR